MKDSSNKSGTTWGIVIALYLVIFFAIGGISVPPNWALIAQSALGIVLLIASLWRLRHAFPNRLAIFGTLLAFAAVALPLLQLIPLPYAMWSHFSGVENILKIQNITGIPPAPSPLSLSPFMTASNAISTLPAFAAFLAGLTMQPKHFMRVCIAVVAFGVFQVLLGLAQRFQGGASFLYFYGPSDLGLAVGTFSNRNFYAAELATALPFIAALMTLLMREHGLRPMIAGLLGITLTGLMLLGLGANESRAGIMMCVPAIIISIFLFSIGGQSDGQNRKFLPIFLGGLVALVLGIASILALLRLARTDQSAEFRSSFAQVTWKAVQQFWPNGSGFGTFIPIYQTLEVPETVLQNYVNHAHNDWLELILEGGAPAAFLLGLFLIWLLLTLYSTWLNNSSIQSSLMQRTASVAVLLLLGHSVVDYPLRTPALMVFFALCCGLMAAPRIAQSYRQKRATDVKVALGGKDQPRKPFQRPTTGFGARDAH